MIAKIVSFFLKLLAERLRLWSSGTPWDYVQSQTNLNIHEWLTLERQEIKSWVIVGGYYGEEIEQILIRFPNCIVDVFEPSARYHGALLRRFAKEPRVRVRNLAISNQNGIAKFYETTLEGSGSLLPLGNHKNVFNSEQAETFEVGTSTLDSLYKNQYIDVLQIDVQGAEGLVLQGSKNVLEKTGAVLIEVAVLEELYKGGTTWSDVNTLLQSSDFFPVLLGLDTNLTGNALFVKIRSV